MAETSLCFVTPRVNTFVEKHKKQIQQPQRGVTFVEGETFVKYNIKIP
jgi:hypothetical protein